MHNTASRKLFLFFIFFTGLDLSLNAQDTSYYKDNGDEVSSLSLSDYYAVLERNPADSNKATVKTYFKSGKIKSEKYYSNFDKKVFDGKFKAYYADGQLRQAIDYKNGKMNGQVLTYWENGKPKRIDNFKNDKFINGKCFNEEGKLIPHTPFERMPEFPGGETGMIFYLRRKIRYPKKARKKRIEGTVVIQFVVGKDGNVINAKVFKSVNPDLDQEALDIVKKMPKWKPGIQDGEPVSVQYSLPIRFNLQ
jgi:TonB family protein